jgi:hypothetical protein
LGEHFRSLVNTWVEDLFLIDVLATLKPNLILDRSLPSGLAFSSRQPPGCPEAERDAAAALWAKKAEQADVKLVHLWASDETRALRGGRNIGWEGQAVADEVKRVKSAGLPVFSFDIGTLSIEEVFHVISGLKGWS